MKQTIVLASLLFLTCFSSNAQMTLVHSYGLVGSKSEIVNLSLSGKKIMVVNPIVSYGSLPNADTVNFYNLDFSFWKRIVCPIVPGFRIFSTPVGNAMVFYPSETLFNTDPLLELGIFYIDSLGAYFGGDTGKIMIINETGAIIDSMPNVFNHELEYGSYVNQYDLMRVYAVDTVGIGFQAIVSTLNGVDIYNLPGTLPCNSCSGIGRDLGINERSKNSILTQPLPNPSANEVKITFKLPEGANEANLVLYSTTGQKLRTYTVDTRFGYILLDNSQLASGVYYYNIEVNGTVSSTQKMVVVK